jgi:hypothetical protein
MVDRDDIIRMAREAEIPGSWDLNWFDPYLESFAALVAKHTMLNIDPSKLMSFQEGFEAGQLSEREACAKVCEEVGDRDTDTHAYDCASAIRARGTK